MDIHIQTIPHKQQRYETVGDYFANSDGSTEVRISDMGNEDYAFLVALHELIEFWLTQKRGIKEEDITAFDIMFEEERKEGKHSAEDEPGDDPRAPYRDEHRIATIIEMLIARELEVDWFKYDEAVTNVT